MPVNGLRILVNDHRLSIKKGRNFRPFLLMRVDYQRKTILNDTLGLSGSGTITYPFS